MNTAEKINKLGSAVRDYKGVHKDGHPNLWIRSPQPKARKRIERWCRELGLDFAQAIAAVEGFKHVDEFRAWIGKVGT